jgi:hypothetical protein
MNLPSGYVANVAAAPAIYHIIKSDCILIFVFLQIEVVQPLLKKTRDTKSRLPPSLIFSPPYVDFKHIVSNPLQPIVPAPAPANTLFQLDRWRSPCPLKNSFITSFVENIIALHKRRGRSEIYTIRKFWKVRTHTKTHTHTHTHYIYIYTNEQKKYLFGIILTTSALLPFQRPTTPSWVSTWI